VPTEKTNEIPIARNLFEKLELDGRIVSLNALYTQDETARVLVMEHGADYLLTVKKNQPTIHETLDAFIDAPATHFFSPKTGQCPPESQKPPAPAPIEQPAPTRHYGHVPPPEQQPLRALDLKAEEARTQNHHRFF